MQPILSANDKRSGYLVFIYVACMLAAMQICDFDLTRWQAEMFHFVTIIPMAYLFSRILFRDPTFLIEKTRDQSTVSDQFHTIVHRGLRSGATYSIVISVVIFIFRTFFG